MSGRVCYLARAGRVEGPALVRLVGSGTDESWERPGAPEDAPAVVAQTAQAADWVAQRAAQGDGPRNEIAILCVDVDGASCAWITAPSSGESVVAAVMAQGGGSDWSGFEGGAWAPPTPSEASVQALAAPPVPAKGLRRPGRAVAGQPVKMAIAAVPDVDARLFVDALDDRGVAVERAISLWHAMAMAWDPAGAPAAAAAGEHIVASSAPATAGVLIDPAGRLVWSWSRAGELLAAGSLRLTWENRDGESLVVLGKTDVARLVSDWLSWSVQIGMAPVRIICIGPRTGSETGDGLSPAALGAALTKSWPGATVDLAVHDDPIGATLRRLAGAAEDGSPEDGRRGLVSLSRRPGRAHRSLYQWGAIVIFALAAALGAVAWKSLNAAEHAKSERDKVKAGTVEAVAKHAAPANDMQQIVLNDSPSAFLREALNKRKAALNPNAGLEPAEPILSELETLSLVMGFKGVEIEEITLLNSGAIIYVKVPDTRTGEDIKKSLDEIGSSHCDWSQPVLAALDGDRKRLTLYGKWKPQRSKP